MYGQPGAGLEIEDRNKIFEPGYLPDDFGGIRKLKAGGYVAITPSLREAQGKCSSGISRGIPRSFPLFHLGSV